ncbi:S-layer homology domain-containing protein [Aminipila sp.]|uniref:S-layer homology domain-containing protein n=1 Tax=Aminipila sp. TaxID=2060095 RepID=UPI00289B0141|nr:S-layer homology domain-containing protein [Aminipila sp.]
MKRIITMLLCGVFVCVGAYVTTGESYAEHWADQYLNNLVSQQIMRGDDDGNLNPDNNITRAEFVAMLNRAFGYGKKGDVAFNDVPIEAWYYDDISIAKKQGYFNGIYPDTAGPDKYLKREEAVTMLCRALKIQGVESDTLRFSDSRSFSGWSKEYINAAVEKNFLSGYPDQTFKPSDYMKRGEMAKVLSEVAGEIVKEQGSNYIGYANGNVSVVQTGASLRNTIVPGDLYITAGMGTGYTQLENLVVGGDLIISGTGNAEKGEVSVILTDCDINNLVIDSGSSDIMSVRAEGGSVIQNTTVKSNAYLEEDGSKSTAFKDVILKGPSGTTLSLSGAFEDVVVKGENNKLSVDKGSVDSLTVDEDAVKGSVFIQKDAVVYAFFCDIATTITGTGTIEEISINAKDCNVAMLPEHIYIRPGITAVVNGQTMTSLDAEASNAAPEFLSSYPKYQDLQATSVKLLAKTNKPGKVYWAIKNIDVVGQGMTEEEVKNPDKRYVVKSGNINVVGDKEVTINVSGLLSGVNYQYYMVFEDMKEERTGVERESFKTVDTVVPKFLNGTPKIQSSTKDSFKMVAMPSKDVTLYWAILPSKSVPPTIESLAELKVSGALGKGSVGGTMNEPIEIPMRGTDDKPLAENVAYDIYMVLRDESGNLSALAKVIGTTLDQTPPEFMDGYPWNEPGTANALRIRHMSTEAGTLYWAAYPFDFKFPPVEDFDSITDAAIKKELKVRAITTGQKAVKNGKVTVNEKKDALLQIAGLDKQTPYDVYFVLMDKAGNYSEPVSLLGLKTLDKEPPAAVMDFDKVLDGNPLVSSNISVVFDEIVYYDGTEKDIRLSQLPVEQKSDILKKMFSVHDLLSVSKPDYLSGIDFEKVQIGEKDGKTIVTFPQEAFGGGSGLNSGGHYQFELNNVVDSDGNAMSQATLLKSFKVVAPQVYMSRYNGSEVLEDNEIGFSLKKADGVNSDKYFDVIIQTDTLITFDLYVNNVLYASDIRLEAGQARSVASMKPADGYQKFADITDTNYKLYIKNFNSRDKDKISSWDGTLNIKSMAVIGEPHNLTNLGTEILNAGNPLEIVKNNEDTMIVSNPDVFGVKRVYADSAQPGLIDGIKYEVYDTAVNVVVMADKASKLYYVIVPFNNMAGKEAPTVDQILAGLPAYLDSKSGTINLADGQSEYEELIDGLKPNTAYKFFYVLKGKASDNLKVENTDLSDYEFKTEPPIVPVLTEGPIPTGISNDKSVEMKGTANTDSIVYWVMYAGGAYPDKTDPNTGAKVPYFSPEQVIQLSNEDGSVVDSGNFSVNKSNDLNKDKEGLQFIFDCKNMDPTKTYDIFVALESEYSGEMSEKTFVYKNVRSKDTVPPYVLDTNTVIKERSVTSSGGIEIAKYEGYVSVNFNEPLYYKNSLAGDVMKPLTENELIQSNGEPLAPKDGGLLAYDREGVELNVEVYKTQDADNGKYPVTGLEISFKGILDGSTISINGEIYDRAGWRAGKFVMTFVENEDPKKSAFTVRFIEN